MGYGLGVDLGTTFTAAAVERDGRVEMATLGDRAAAVPSVVLLRSDGAVLTGDAADRRAASEPDRVAREVKRRLGDPVPVLLGGAPQPVQELMAMQLRDVVRAVATREGGPPEQVTLTHPANWGPYKRELFGQIPRRAGLDRVRMITEPEAAAAYYASTERVPEGTPVAVYDLGGGTFDATVLRTSGDGFEILGTPEGIEGLGGVDFDEAVYAHVDRALDGALSGLDPMDLRATAAAIRLRHECVLAKEALSADTEATIPVLLPTLQTEVRLTRGEFESMIQPAVGATVEALRRALRSGGVRPGDLHTVLLVGGSSRIPVIARMVSAEMGRPTSVDAHPKHAIALGAASTSRRASRGGEAAGAPAPGHGGPIGPRGPVGPPTPPGGSRYGAAGYGAAGGAAAGGAAAAAHAPGATPPGGTPATPPGGTAAAYEPAGPTDVFHLPGSAGQPHGEPAYGAPAAPGSTAPMPPVPSASAAGAPPPPLSAPPAVRKRRKTGVLVGAGVLVAAAAAGAALFYGAASGAAPAGPTATPSPMVAAVPTTEPAVVTPEPAAPTTRARPRSTAGPEVVPTPERVAPREPVSTPNRPARTSTPSRTSTSASTSSEPSTSN